MKPGTSRIVDIESLAYRGEGIGHVQNKVIFVPLTAPGDQVELTISENKKNYLLMHAMGPNAAGVIGSAVAAGYFLGLF